MSELDESRRSSLMTYAYENVQTFITTTNTGYFNDEMLNSSQLVYLR